MNPPSPPPKPKHFSPFRTAAEEVADMKTSHRWEDEGGQLAPPPARGRMVRTPAEAHAYKVVLEHAHGGETEHPCETMMEGEAFIRSETPAPEARNPGRDPPAGGRGRTTNDPHGPRR